MGLIPRSGSRLGRKLGSRAAACPPTTPADGTSLDQFARRAASEATATRADALDVGPQSGRYGCYFEPGRYRSVELQTSAPAATGRTPRFPFHELPLADEQFGLVFCAGLIERTIEPPGVLVELNRVLALRGTLFLAAPLIVPERLGEHLARLPRYGLNYLLEKSGFMIEDLQQLAGEPQPAMAYAVVARKTRRPGHHSPTGR
jgi:hypothetical protein